MKKLILALAIAISGMIVACSNSTTNSENDSVITDTITEEVVDTCTCDTVCVDTCPVCDSVE